MKKRPVMLMILDGYGIAPATKGNAVTLANKPNLDRLFSTYPHAKLEASGLSVGLPEGQMGNSEVGHMNIGAGRVVYQSLTRINKAIADGDFDKNPAINEAIDKALENGKKFHIFALASDGGVHSHVKHVCAIAALAHKKGIKDVYYHAFLDGRDVPQQSALKYLDYVAENGKVEFGTIGGRFYGMDRDNNWERVQVAYDAMTEGKCEHFNTYTEGIEASYKAGVNDEFVVPFMVNDNSTVQSGDSVVFANFRPDRAIRIATAISNPDSEILSVPSKEGKILDTKNGPRDVFFVSMMKYSSSVKGPLAFGLQEFSNLFGDVVSKAGLKQLRIAETEKYAHVTFFFDGGADREIEGADRVLVNSPAVATYDLKPEMSAYELTEKVEEALLSEKYDTIILNFANCDMVGHTGIIPAVIKAVETVDECVGRVIKTLDKVGGVAVITADHGNADRMLDEEGNVVTSHSTNEVPVLVTDKEVKIHDGILSDLAPTLLELLDVKKPVEMTSNSIIEK